MLSISEFSGITPRDPFTVVPLNGQPFTTRDRDNDNLGNRNCAVDGHGTNATGILIAFTSTSTSTMQDHRVKGSFTLVTNGTIHHL